MCGRPLAIRTWRFCDNRDCELNRRILQSRAIREGKKPVYKYEEENAKGRIMGR